MVLGVVNKPSAIPTAKVNVNQQLCNNSPNGPVKTVTVVDGVYHVTCANGVVMTSAVR